MLTSHIESKPAIKSNLSFLHLQAELIRIDILILRAVRAWQQAHQNQETTDIFQGHYISDAEINALSRQPLGTSWWQGVLSSAETHQDILEQTTQRVGRLRQTARQQQEPLRLDYLGDIFGLTSFEVDALLVCLAPALDRRYERFYGYLQDDANRRWPSINLILDLLGQPGPDRLLNLPHFAENAPLRKHRLLMPVREPGIIEPPLLNQAFRPDPTIVAWLLGDYQLPAKLGPSASLIQPLTTETDGVLAGNTLRQLWPGFEQEDGQDAGQPLIFAFYGADEMSQFAAARLLAAKMKRPLLSVDLADVPATGPSWLETLELTLRDAQLTQAIPFCRWDSCLNDGAPPPDLLERLCAYPGWVIVASSEMWQSRKINRQQRLVWLNYPTPSAARRRILWTHFLAQLETAETLDIAGLAGQFALNAGQIQGAVAAVQDIVFQRGTPLQNADLFAAARDYSNPRLAKLAEKIEPRYTWQDLVLPDDQLTMLHELVATVRGRPLVLEEWELGRKLASSAGIAVLFTGPPGTGKTMAAGVLARELGLDLYKIDLSTVVSKYIGETEKNLSQIFREAENSNAILFFDEADALFGKRSEVKDSHDRYANIEISYLLQRMEAYNGVAILATNLRANLDEAFTRRLQFVLDFPFPDETDRERIWQTLFPANVPSQGKLDFALLAQRFKLAGGNVRNIIVNAAYLAAAGGKKITMEHLLHSTRRELQKMGRLIGDKDFEIQKPEE